jgi:hypothetical protein
MAKFKIYGDYGYTTETLLEEFDTRSEAIRWAEAYAESGDFGGYTCIEVAWFAESGEYVVERGYDAEDWEDETVFYEGDDDFPLIDEF